MTRGAFLSDPHVQEFIPWLRERFAGDGTFTHSYTDRQRNSTWRCDGLFHALTTYQWARQDWAATKRDLDGFRQRLRDAVAQRDNSAAFEECAKVLRWGGVWARNGIYLEKRRPVLIDELLHVSAVLQSDAEPTRDSMRRIPSDRESECRMNAGFVKIYSVLLDYFVIYDGRVGAALGLLVRHFCEQTARQEVPPLLRFAYGSPKEAESPVSPKTRNPSAGGYTFPRLRPDSCFHSSHAMRASWLLKAVVDGGCEPFSPGEEGFHEIAAALFMVGYDLD